jgi:DNA invertase Pin-like site-specific DNA recombinase
MKACAYLRVSGKGQIEKDGPERQREAIAAFMKQFELLPYGEFFEEGVSGTVEGIDRPAFMGMLSKVESEQGPFCIVIERLDRIARDLMVQELILKECRTRKIKVYSTDRGALIDLASEDGDPTQKLIRQVMGAVAEWEKSVIVLKLRKSRNRVRAEKGHCEGPKPFGLKNPVEAQTLNFMKKWKSEGLSYRKIAEALNGLGLKTYFGNPWQGHSVFRAMFPRQQKPK